MRADPCRFPLRSQRLIDSAERRTRASLRSGRLGRAVGAARLPAAPARSTRLSGPQGTPGATVRRRRRTAFPAVYVGARFYSAHCRLKRVADLRAQFGVSDWALEQLFGGRPTAPGPGRSRGSRRRRLFLSPRPCPDGHPGSAELFCLAIDIAAAKGPDATRAPDSAPSRLRTVPTRNSGVGDCAHPAGRSDR